MNRNGVFKDLYDLVTKRSFVAAGIYVRFDTTFYLDMPEVFWFDCGTLISCNIFNFNQIFILSKLD
jgi:hypothetical protein